MVCFKVSQYMRNVNETSDNALSVRIKIDIGEKTSAVG